MTTDQQASLSQRLLERLNLFFSDSTYSLYNLEEALDNGEIFYKPSDILPFLQTALMDEKFIEVEMGGITQLYFSRLFDQPPQSQTSDGETAIDYGAGDYLKKYSHLITLPLEPGMGNYNIRYSNKLVLRFFTSAYAVELGTFYQDQDHVEGLPVLRLDYPVIGRIVRGSREYRAKVPLEMNMELVVIGKRKKQTFTTRLVNISVSGFAFSIEKNQQRDFIEGENRSLEIFIDDNSALKLKASVRHVSKIRGKKGTEFLCGVQADLVTRAVAARLEEIVALVQRAHLRELVEISQESGIPMLK